jgi:hypothetical protein
MPVLDREEYIEQAYFFQAFRERLLDGMPSQEILARVGEELLSTTRLPVAISFILSEIKLTGAMSPAMARIGHYFTAFQTHVITQAEIDTSRFSMDQALLVLEREARYKSQEPTQAGLFVFQFETLSRNRLGYGKGLEAMAGDPYYNDDWREYMHLLRSRLGDVDFADLLFVRSAYYLNERKRMNPEFQAKFPVLFGEKEGKIARANRGRDPLFLFSALQRQLGYPEVPRPRRPDEAEARITILEQRIMLLENRIRTLESELHDDVVLSQFTVKTEDTAGSPAGWGIRREEVD